MNLRDRDRDYQFSTAENNILFNSEFENIGFVRIKSLDEKSFYLDPSPFDNTRKNEYYILKNCPIPIYELKNGMLIEVIVSEEEKKVNFKKGQPDSFSKVRYVTNCRLVNPNKILKNKRVSKEQFIEYLSIPIKDNQWDALDISFLTGMYLIASPQLVSEVKGGINAGIITNFHSKDKYAAFNKMTSIIPSELKKPISNNYYFSTDYYETRKSDSIEISGAYYDVYEYPVHTPINFDVRYDDSMVAKENFNNVLPDARRFMIDALLFNPHIPDDLYKRMEEAMRFIFDEFFSDVSIPYCIDLGNCIPKLVTSFARINFNPIVTSKILDDGLKIWHGSIENSVNSTEGFSADSMYRNTSYTDTLRQEISDMYYSNIPLYISNIKANTKIPEWQFYETLDKLNIAGIVYFRSSNELGFLDY